MAQDMKLLKTRIGSVGSMLHTTKAMGLVASSKVRRATDSMMKARQYLAAYRNVNGILLSLPVPPESRYFGTSVTAKLPPEEEARTVVIVIAGDRSLAGGYNSSVWKTVEALKAERNVTEIIPIGRKACEKYGGNGYPVEKLSYSEITELAESLCKRFLAAEFDRLELVYTRYKSVLTQVPEREVLLPVQKPEKAVISDCIMEPGPQAMVSRVVPGFVAAAVYAFAKESFCSEVVARRTAMDNSTRNAEKMLDELTLSYNRARQSAITNEITEIVAGADS